MIKYMLIIASIWATLSVIEFIILFWHICYAFRQNNHFKSPNTYSQIYWDDYFKENQNMLYSCTILSPITLLPTIVGVLCFYIAKQIKKRYNIQ